MRVISSPAGSKKTGRQWGVYKGREDVIEEIIIEETMIVIAPASR